MSITINISDNTPNRVDTVAIDNLIEKSNNYKQTKSVEIIRKSYEYACSAYFQNSFIGSIFRAYNKHNNIVLRPEDFWSAILTQFSNYVNNNSEQLRNKFVNFSDKQDLEVYGKGNLYTAEYNKLVVDMTNEIQKNLIDNTIKEWIMPNFSTTTDTDKIVASIALMASMQKYFNYKFCLECGIPSVTLLGTKSDYENLRRKLDKLLEFDLDGKMNKWHQLLTPIFDELIHTVQGNPNLNFWRHICHHIENGSGPTYLTGWLTAFCVFDDKGKWQGDQFMQDDYVYKINNVSYPVIDTNDIQPGFVNVPLIINDNGAEYTCHLFAGHFGFDKKDEFTIQPRLDWVLSLVEPQN